MTDSLALDYGTAAQVLAAQPFAELVGTQLTAFGDGAATLVVPIRPELRQQFGYVHGGVLSYLADNALTFAAGTVLGANVLTGGFSITYLRPAAGERLRAEARVTGSTRRQAVVNCEIYAESEPGAVDGLETRGAAPVLCAVAQGTTRAVDRALG
ncbi:hypothetical protein CJ469_03151 [Nocardia farcinica]|uniref:PaaI family thioesterase n=1 Tax=Nocardia farcinica TaxID=37329 RepID=UPI000BF7C34C|nr:PaaI family thioesterase [Nocardia farcinica]PFX01836.1 hypothetical protein CJ469_03151 [Nocardia farcinica]PFX08931.1 hypothetical protein CJ468_02178 [Nocardia farcinica]